MAVSQSYHAILVMGIVFCVLPHYNTGLLSDYKICGDSECERPMSRVQAIMDHRGKDCRYLNFRRGDTIFVYHKLTGKRDDLWAGTIDKQFGYFPKDRVQEELLYATVENVVATQESDFFCTDEFGYLVDSTHLDNDANEDDAVKKQEQVTTQTTPYLDDNNAESPSTSEEVSTESVGSAQESESSIKEEAEGNTTNAGDAAAGTTKEAQDPAASTEQGGSASSSWLGSSVTGWIGLTKEEEPANLAEGQKEEAKEETPEASSFTSSMTGWLGIGGGGGRTDDEEVRSGQEDAEMSESYTSTMTGWLGFRGGGKTDDEEVRSGQEDAETSESYTSTVTGWLGFGGEKKPESSAEKEEEEEMNRDEEQEQAETFRSRRMSLDLEGSQLHEEEEAGTFDWFGNRLTSTLGFGQTNQESEMTSGRAEEAAKEEEQASGSWYDMGFGGMLGLGTDKSDESTGGGFQGTQMDENLDQNLESERVDTSQSQPTVTEEMTTEVGGISKDDNRTSETDHAESKSNMDDNGNTDGVSADSAASEATGGMPSMPDNLTQIESLEKEEHDVLDDDEKEKSALDGERATEMEGEHHQIAQTIKYNDDDRQTREEDFKTANETDQDILTQSDTGPLLDFDLKSDTTEQSAGEVKEDIRENLLGDSAEIQGETDGSADKSHEISARVDSDEFGVNKEETKTEGAKGESLTGSGAEDSSAENNNPISNKHETLTQVEGTTDQKQEESVFNESNLKSEAEITEEEESKEEEERRELGEVKEEEEVVKTQGKQQEVDEEKKDEEEIKQQEVEEITEKEKLVELKEEKIQREVEEIKENQVEVGESKDEENHGGEEAKEGDEQIKTQEKHQRVDEEKKDEEEELKKEGKQQEMEEIIEREKLVELEEERIQREVEEIEENQEEVGESKDEENHGVEEAKEGDKQIKTQEKYQRVDEEKKDEEEEELNEEVKHQEVGEITEREKLVELEELKEEKIQREEEEIEENQEEVRESKDEENHGGEEAKEEEKQVDLEEEKQIKMQEKHQGVDEEKKDEEEELKEEGKQQELEEITESEKPVELEELKEEKIQKEVEEIEGNQEELGESKEEEKHREEEAKEDEEKDEVKEEQQLIEELKEDIKGAVEELKVMEQTEDLKKLEEEGEKERKDSKEDSKFEPNMEIISSQASESKEEEVNDDKSSDTSTQSEERQRENPHMEVVQMQEENKQTEHMNETKDVVEKVGRERREQEEEECKGECIKARDGKDSLDAGVEKTDPVAEITEGTQTILEGTERDEEGVEEEERNDDAENRKTEDVNSNTSDIISDLNALGVNQTEDMKYTTNDLPQFVEDIQDDRSGEASTDQTAEVKENNQLDSTELKIPELRGGEALHQESETNDEETSSKGNSTEWKTEQTNAENNTEERKITVKHRDEKEDEDADVKVPDGFQSLGTELNEEEKIQASEVFESQTEVSGQTVPQHSTGFPLPPDDPENMKTESGGAFGLFRNAFGFFRQIPAPETKESAQSLDSNTHEIPESHTSLTPEQVPDTSQVYSQDLHTDTPVTVSEQPPSPTQTSHIHSSANLQNNESPFQSKTFSKHYKNLLTYMRADDTDILMELFGRHKLQFLDDISGSTETMTGDPDTDESILLDIERLLHHHREVLIAPSMKQQDVQQEDKEKTRALIALQKLEMLLDKVRETFSTGKPDTSNTEDQDGRSCVEGSCSTSNKEISTEEAHGIILDSHTPKDERVVLDKEEDKQISGGWATEDEEEREPQELKGTMQQMINNVHKITEDSSTHVHAARELLIWLTIQVVSALPDDIRPGPDLYGVPWEPVIVSSLVGLVTVLLFTCRCYSSVKSRLYRSKEHWMAEQVSQLLDEKCKVLETLSKCQQEYDDLETSLRDSGVLAQTQKTEQLEAKARQLGHAKNDMERDLEQLKDQLDQQREHRKEQERRIAVLEESMKTFEDEAKDLQSQEEQAQTTLKVYSMNSERLQRNLETAGEENTLLQESNAQLRQQVEGWAERVGELEAEISRCKVAHSGMLQDVTNKDERIWSLTDRLLRMKAWDSDLEEEGYDEGEKDTSNGTAGKGGENGKGDRTETPGHLQKVQKLIYAAKLNADLKSVDEDKDRAFAKLNDEIKAKEDLQVSIKELEKEKLSLQSDSEHYSDQVQRLQQKLNIMTEMYQENELKLHRMLTVEEKDRMQKEERLNKADKNIALAMEELNNYRQRAEEMEEELEKTKQSYQTQISAHEKKAHNNWLASRAAERELADIRRENALLRQKLTDTQFKLDTLDKDPYALDNLARPLPFRAERSPYGPSPLGRPASETRAFLSPPTLMDGPPARLSPRGYMFPEPGAPIYRRPPPPPGALGPFPASGPFPPGVLPPRGLPPGPYHPAEMADGPFRENSFGPGDQDPRESGTGDRRTPPEADPRMGGPPPPGIPMGPGDGPFPRRAPYGPPPPDFYPPRGPGIPPMRPMWAPPPPGMMYPPRFPHGGPLPPHPHQAPPMRPPLSDIHPPPSMGPPLPRQPLPSPPHSQSPEEHTPSPEDAI
ncbi:melanoma inhibitory activity protein 2 isoform X2 [Cheilinus undulatus]|uniref:melanoma inhibitory activity protein 2 isoform X2 n=1 Tax=Cheilinus undulatus TaxID=241271 RepID=UPI001BD35879|nr:melanoma inhibitory activity protein 2 isoform X2 [Cheilinus undulatus]